MPKWAQVADALTKLMSTAMLVAFAGGKRFAIAAPSGKAAKEALLVTLAFQCAGRAVGSSLGDDQLIEHTPGSPALLASLCSTFWS